MRHGWLGVGLVALSLAAHTTCLAGEIAGKLERIDIKTVTLRNSENEQVVLKVDRQDRSKAAPFIGKWVKVQFTTNNGDRWAVVFVPPAN